MSDSKHTSSKTAIKKVVVISLLIFSHSILFSQSYKSEYGSPLIVLTEADPWLMVIGSDVPTFVLYENGQILYKKTIHKKTKYFEVKIKKENIQEMIKKFGVTDSLQKLSKNIVASEGTDQPTNELILNFDSLKQIAVYGSLRYEKSEDRLKTPQAFLRVYDNIIHFEDDKAKKWLPDTIEVMLTNYSHSPEKPLAWPKEWPDLKNQTTVKRNDNLYSVYLDKKELVEFIKLIHSLKEKQAIEVNGQKFSVAYRLPFPNIR